MVVSWYIHDKVGAVSSHASLARAYGLDIAKSAKSVATTPLRARRAAAAELMSVHVAITAPLGPGVQPSRVISVAVSLPLHVVPI